MTMTPFLACLSFCFLTTATAEWRSGERQQVLLRANLNEVMAPNPADPAVLDTCKDLNCNMQDIKCSTSCRCGAEDKVCQGEHMFCCGTDCTGATKGCMVAKLSDQPAVVGTRKNGGDITVTVDLVFTSPQEKAKFKALGEFMEAMHHKVVYKVVDMHPQDIEDTKLQLFEVYDTLDQLHSHATEDNFLVFRALKGPPSPALHEKCPIDPSLKKSVKDKLAELGYTAESPYPFSEYPVVKKWVDGVAQGEGQGLEPAKPADATPQAETDIAQNGHEVS